MFWGQFFGQWNGAGRVVSPSQMMRRCAWKPLQCFPDIPSAQGDVGWLVTCPESQDQDHTIIFSQSRQQVSKCQYQDWTWRTGPKTYPGYMQGFLFFNSRSTSFTLQNQVVSWRAQEAIALGCVCVCGGGAVWGRLFVMEEVGGSCESGTEQFPTSQIFQWQWGMSHLFLFRVLIFFFPIVFRVWQHFGGNCGYPLASAPILDPPITVDKAVEIWCFAPLIWTKVKNKFHKIKIWGQHPGSTKVVSRSQDSFSRT